MKVLWITYAALGRAAELLENTFTQSGTWIDATASALIKEQDIELCVVSISTSSQIIVDENTKIIYRGVSEIKQVSGGMPPETDTCVWTSIIADFMPDIIMIWGTEYANGYSVLKAAKNIPVLFFIQGVIGKIVEYPLGLLSMKDVVKRIGPVSAIKFLHFLKNHRAQFRQKEIEKKMVQQASGILTDNEWANAYYNIIAPNTQNFFYPLPVNSIFLQGERNNVEKHSIFTVDGGNPAKGIFHLIKAIAIVKERFPDVKLYIPGRVPRKKPAFIYESPYYTYLKKEIKHLKLSSNVVFLGQQTQQEMKEHLLKCNIFVMPSSIENHSSSLREAMYMGVPCISALVGSVAEFTVSGDNALTYRYEEEDILAAQIIKLFENDSYAYNMGCRAKVTIHDKFSQIGLGRRMKCIYKEVLKHE